MFKNLRFWILVLGFLLVAGSTSALITSILPFPDGADKDVQFNESGLFGADTGEFTYDPDTNNLTASTMTATHIITSTITVTNVIASTITVSYDLLVKKAGGSCAVQDTTNTGVYSVGNSSASVSMVDNSSFTFTVEDAGFLTVTDKTNGKAGAFFVEKATSTIVEVADPSAYFEITDTDSSGNWAVYKTSDSAVINIKNYTNGTASIRINVLGTVISATVP